MKFLPFINHFIIRPQGNTAHSCKTGHVLCPVWGYRVITIRETKTKCLFVCTSHANVRNCCGIYIRSYCVRAIVRVLFSEFCMHVDAYKYVHTGLHKPLCLCAEILAGYEDSSPWLLLHSRSTLCRREISSISSFMWCGTVKGWGGEGLGYHRPYNMCHQCFVCSPFYMEIVQYHWSENLFSTAILFVLFGFFFQKEESITAHQDMIFR